MMTQQPTEHASLATPYAGALAMPEVDFATTGETGEVTTSSCPGMPLDHSIHTLCATEVLLRWLPTCL